MSDLPYDDEIIQMLGEAEELKIDGEHEKAIDILEHIILEDPICYEAFEEIGDNYLSIRETGKAEKALKQAILINPESSNAHYLLGFMGSLNERWKESVTYLQKADSLSPNHPEILRCLGWAFYNANRKRLPTGKNSN